MEAKDLMKGPSWKDGAAKFVKDKQAELERKYGKAPEVRFELVPSHKHIVIDGKTLDWSKSPKKYGCFEFMAGRRTVTADEISKVVYDTPLAGKSERLVLTQRFNITKLISRMRIELKEAFGYDLMISVNPKIHEFALEPRRLLSELSPAPVVVLAPTPAAEEEEEVMADVKGTVEKVLLVAARMKKADPEVKIRDILAKAQVTMKAWCEAIKDEEDKELIEKYREIFGRYPRGKADGVPPKPKKEKAVETVEESEAEEEEETEEEEGEPGDHVDALYQIIRMLEPYKPDVRTKILRAAETMVAQAG